VPKGATLPELRRAAEECRGCPLWEGADHVVFGAGNPGAELMLVGEQPGDREDREGRPFVGPAGELLDEALASAGINRQAVYLTNAVKHFRHHVGPHGMRRIHDKPAVTHIVACHPWLDAERSLLTPRVIVCLGATAGRAVLGRPVKVTAERGRLLTGDEAALTLLTAHPSAVLRLRGKPGFEEAFDALVADLEVARDA
jgi:DNA polymerase